MYTVYRVESNLNRQHKRLTRRTTLTSCREYARHYLTRVSPEWCKIYISRDGKIVAKNY